MLACLDSTREYVMGSVRAHDAVADNGLKLYYLEINIITSTSGGDGIQPCVCVRVRAI